jgi:RecA/RadA recombinase
MSTLSKYGDTMDKSDISTVDHYIASGNYLLNACLTGSIYGGYPNNRAIALAGPSGTGKTYLLLNAIREAQKQGYSIVFYDSENAVDRDLVVKFGIDPAKFRYEPCNTVQEFRTSITNLTEKLIEQKDKGVELPKIMVCLDSAGNLATQKEIDDARSASDKRDMTRQQMLKSTFRIIMTQLGICKIPFLFTNHTYAKIDFIGGEIAGGGTGPEYAASIILFLGKAQLKENGNKVGLVINIRPNKNRFAKPIPIKIHLSFDKGMNPYVGLQDYISWENCGIQRGKMISPNDYNKLSEAKQKECHPMQKIDNDGNKSDMYFQPSETAQRMVVEHLGKAVKLNELFTPSVIDDSVLKKLEPIIKDHFSYGPSDGESFDDILFEPSEEAV